MSSKTIHQAATTDGAAVPAQPYSYPLTNSELIAQYSLAQYEEGGLLAETLRIKADSAGSADSQVAAGQLATWYGRGATADKQLASATGLEVASVAYYLQTPDACMGVFHRNQYAHIHVLISGRAEYTLIKPAASPLDLPEVHKFVMGENAKKGEIRQLYLPGGWWKKTMLPADDLALADELEDGKDPSRRQGEGRMPRLRDCHPGLAARTARSA